jgi:hypothetical protein
MEISFITIFGIDVTGSGILVEVLGNKKFIKHFWFSVFWCSRLEVAWVSQLCLYVMFLLIWVFIHVL